MASDDALDLLSKMFMYDPKARISALQALEHRYENLSFTFPISDFWLSILFYPRYFSSGPPPTEPALLPRPPPKRDSLNSKVSDFNQREGPIVLSPPRKSRRVMPHREGIDGHTYQVDKVDDHVDEIKPAAGERSEHVPMSLDFSVFGARPPSRPTINR